jgi:hypothetical protein
MMMDARASWMLQMEEYEAILLFDENAVGFCVLGTCIFDECCPHLQEVSNEGIWAVVIK